MLLVVIGRAAEHRRQIWRSGTPILAGTRPLSPKMQGRFASRVAPQHCRRFHVDSTIVKHSRLHLPQICHRKNTCMVWRRWRCEAQDVVVALYRWPRGGVLSSGALRSWCGAARSLLFGSKALAKHTHPYMDNVQGLVLLHRDRSLTIDCVLPPRSVYCSRGSCVRVADPFERTDSLSL